MTLLFKEDEAIGASKKSAIQIKKSAIDETKITLKFLIKQADSLNYTAIAKNNIKKIYKSLKKNQVFGANEIKEILNCTDSALRLLLAKLRDKLKVIEKVKGQGKGKYRLKNSN